MGEAATPRRPWVLSIDFGTTNTAAAACPVGDPDRARPIKLASASTEMPSGVLYDDGRLTTGETAQNTARARAAAAYEPAPKRRIGEQSIVLGGQPLQVVELVEAVFRDVARRAAHGFGGTAPTELRLTHPARWADWRQDMLRDAAAKAALPDPVLVPEPVAAAMWYARQQGHARQGEPLAVYDLGGGTCDVAILRPTARGYEILATDMVDPLGGETFDGRLLELVKESLRVRGQDEVAALFDGSGNVARRRTLADELRRAKHVLSEEAAADVVVELGDISTVVTISRPEFSARIAPDLEASIACVRRALDAADISASQLGSLYLVGGSSFVPLVPELLTRQLGIRPATFDDPKTVTALGALQAPAGATRRPGGTGARPPVVTTGDAVRARRGRVAAYVASGVVSVALLGGFLLNAYNATAAGVDPVGGATSPSEPIGRGAAPSPIPVPTPTPTGDVITPGPPSPTPRTGLADVFPALTGDSNCRDTTADYGMDTPRGNAQSIVGCEFEGFIVDFIEWPTRRSMQRYVDDGYERFGDFVARETYWRTPEGTVGGDFFIWEVAGGYEALWTVDAFLMTGRLFADVATPEEVLDIWSSRTELRMDTELLP